MAAMLLNNAQIDGSLLSIMNRITVYISLSTCIHYELLRTMRHLCITEILHNRSGQRANYIVINQESWMNRLVDTFLVVTSQQTI